MLLFQLFHNFLTNIPLFKRTCLVFGILVVFTILRKIGSYILHLLSRRVDLRTYGHWCIITGSTDGIGKSMATEFAKKGMNLFLIARNNKKLNQTADEMREITKLHGTKVCVSCMDLSEKNEENFENFKNEIKSLDVGILVNCAGVSYPHAMYYDEVPTELLDELVMVNLYSVFRITRIVYTGMRERRRGAIICVGSGASKLPCEPLYAAYAAVKAGVESFCKNLQAECVLNNILVQCHTPLLVTTKLSKCRRPTFTVLSPDSYAKCALRAIEKGRPYNESTISPNLVHACIIKIANFIPYNLWKSIRLPQVQAIRNKALKKK